VTRHTINPIWRIASALTLGKIQTASLFRTQKVFLTFDDGPHPEHTPMLLDLLQDNEVQATFFLIGLVCQKQPWVLDRITREGHTIGNHTMTHPQMSQLSFREQWRELTMADRILVHHSKSTRLPIRPPRGEVTMAVLAYCLCHSRRLVLWSKDSLDGVTDASAIVERFRKNPIQGGDRLLFHDDSEVAIEALRILLPDWKNRGFQFDANS
jgi:peptidoglycan-N-acetylglucosamine deacetylase